jgi:hypothetical protein
MILMFCRLLGRTQQKNHQFVICDVKKTSILPQKRWIYFFEIPSRGVDISRTKTAKTR